MLNVQHSIKKNRKHTTESIISKKKLSQYNPVLLSEGVVWEDDPEDMRATNKNNSLN